MSRYDELAKKFGLTNEIQPGDSEALAESPRNALADFANPLLDKSINKILPEDYALNIPKQSVADEKDFYNNLPETMAGAAMGSIGKVGGLGKTILKPSAADLAADMGKFGNVAVRPSVADMAASALKTAPAKPLKGQEVIKRFKELFGDISDPTSIASKQKKFHKDAGSPQGYDSWKQEELNKLIRGGE